MGAEHRPFSRLLEELQGVLEPGTLGEAFIGVDREADEVGKGLQRLDAADVWAGPQARQAGIHEPCRHGVGLLSTARRHGSLEVVAVPRLAATGLGVADEVRAHRIGRVNGFEFRR